MPADACRQAVAGDVRHRFRRFSASQIEAVRKVSVKATKLSMSLGISPLGQRPSETSQRPFSIGKMNAPRPSSGGFPRCTNPIQSRGWSDSSKMALA